MKRWIVIHKIKSLYDNGNGLTERKIAKELGLSLRYPHKISIKNNALLDKIWIKIRFKSV